MTGSLNFACILENLCRTLSWGPDTVPVLTDDDHLEDKLIREVRGSRQWGDNHLIVFWSSRKLIYLVVPLPPHSANVGKGNPEGLASVVQVGLEYLAGGFFDLGTITEAIQSR